MSQAQGKAAGAGAGNNNKDANQNKKDDPVWKNMFEAQTKNKRRKQRDYDQKQRLPSSKRSKTSSSSNRRHQNNHSRGHQSHSQSPHGSQRRSQSTNQSTGSSERIQRLQQFLCTLKYRARLPSPPLRPHFLKYPHSNDRFVKYMATNQELNYEWQFHHDSLLPLPLDLMDPDYYNPIDKSLHSDQSQQMNESDAKIMILLNERERKKNKKDDNKISRTKEAFLLETSYLTPGHEYDMQSIQKERVKYPSKYGNDDNDNYGTGRGNNNNKNRYSDANDSNPHSKKNIVKSFKDIENIQKHPNRKTKDGKDITVVAAYDVFPHDDLLENEYTHVTFDKNPSTHSKKLPFMPLYKDQRLRQAKLSAANAILRSVNRKSLEVERKNKMNNDDMDNNNMNDNRNNSNTNRNDHDWFTLYSPNMLKMHENELRLKSMNGSDDDDEDLRIVTHEWTAEYIPSQIKTSDQLFMAIPVDPEADTAYYAQCNRIVKLRHRMTDTVGAGKNLQMKKTKGLSENDRVFFDNQPRYLDVITAKSDDEQ